jgi:di/tricarboxylate transporter
VALFVWNRLPVMMSVAVVTASFLTPAATSVNLMVVGLAGTGSVTAGSLGYR